MDYEAIIVGGSYAGMSAALQLARAHRTALVIDAGLRRNRYAETSHGFLTQDGRAPAEIVLAAKAQLMAYPTVEWREAEAVRAEQTYGGFRVSTGMCDARTSKRLILATGVKDEPPAIPGLNERWGHSVFHCPYCHGYELKRGGIGVLASSALSMHHALMLPDWGHTTFFLNETFVPDAEQKAALLGRGVSIVHGHIARIVGDKADVVMQDGRVFPLDGLFTLTRTSMASPLAEQLGCRFEDGPVGPFVKTDMMKETTVAGVFACGDAARAAGSVAFSVGDGALAGMAAHQSLIFRAT